MARKFIMDVDTGVDDAQALMMLLAQPETDVLAVTCVAGNAGIDNVCRNTLSVLKVMDRLDVPVYRGCLGAVMGKTPDAAHVHGVNGLGNYVDPSPLGLDRLQTEHASCAIVRLVNQHPGEVNLVATAPLTNLALALRLDPSIGDKFKRVVIMGGNMETKGNDFLCAEFNFGADPEAVHITLTGLRCPVTLVTYEVCKYAMNLPWEWYNNLIQVDTPRGRFHRDFDAQNTRRKREILKLEEYYSCDPAAMAVALDESIATDSQSAYCAVELTGQFSRGMLVIDWKSRLGKPPNATLVKALDTSKLQALFEGMVA